jgi:hypothetical protein
MRITITMGIRIKLGLKISMGITIGSRGSSGSIVSDYGLDDRCSIPDRGRGFFF